MNTADRSKWRRRKTAQSLRYDSHKPKRVARTAAIRPWVQAHNASEPPRPAAVSRRSRWMALYLPQRRLESLGGSSPSWWEVPPPYGSAPFPTGGIVAPSSARTGSWRNSTANHNTTRPTNPVSTAPDGKLLLRSAPSRCIPWVHRNDLAAHDALRMAWNACLASSATDRTLGLVS